MAFNSPLSKPRPVFLSPGPPMATNGKTLIQGSPPSSSSKDVIRPDVLSCGLLLRKGVAEYVLYCMRWSIPRTHVVFDGNGNGIACNRIFTQQSFSVSGFARPPLVTGYSRHPNAGQYESSEDQYVAPSLFSIHGFSIDQLYAADID